MTATTFVTMKTSVAALKLLRQVAELTGEKQYRLMERLLRNEHGRAHGMKLIGANPKQKGKSKRSRKH